MAKLGTEKRPAIVRVQTEQREVEIAAICEENGWQFILGLEPDKPEDISDVEKPMNPQKTSSSVKIGHNDPCPCGSGGGNTRNAVVVLSLSECLLKHLPTKEFLHFCSFLPSAAADFGVCVVSSTETNLIIDGKNTPNVSGQWSWLLPSNWIRS